MVGAALRADRTRLVSFVRRVAEFSGVKLLAYCIMSNHFHVFVYIGRPEPLSDAEIVRRISALYSDVRFEQVMTNRLETEVDPEMKALLKEQIKHMDKVIDKAERLCLETVEKNDRMNALRERFTQVGGVGDLTAIAILAGLPEIGKLPDAKLNRLVGIAPEERQSGTKEWQRRIWGGRRDVRNALYMAAVASIMWNSTLGTYYRKKRAEGHPHKWAIVPTMRKLLSLLNRIARDPTFSPRPEPESTKRNAIVGRKRQAA